MGVTATWVRVLSSVVVLAAMVSARPEVSAASGGCPESWSYTWEAILVQAKVDGVVSEELRGHQLLPFYLARQGSGSGGGSCVFVRWLCRDGCGIFMEGYWCEEH